MPLLWEDDMGRYPCDKHPQLKNPLPLAYNCKSVTTPVVLIIFCVADTSKFSALTTFRGPKVKLPINNLATA